MQRLITALFTFSIYVEVMLVFLKLADIISWPWIYITAPLVIVFILGICFIRMVVKTED